jgi:hypothetical protein
VFEFLGLPTDDGTPLFSEENERRQRWQNRRKKTHLVSLAGKSGDEVDAGKDRVDARSGHARRVPHKLPKKPVVKLILDSSASAMVRHTASSFFFYFFESEIKLTQLTCERI